MSGIAGTTQDADFQIEGLIVSTPTKPPRSWVIISIIVTLASALAALLFYIFAQNANDFWSQIWSNFAAVIFAGGIFSWWGAYIARREIHNSVLKMFDLKKSLESAGIESVITWPIDIPNEAHAFDCLVIRAHSWIGLVSKKICEAGAASKSNVRILMLNPNSDSIVHVLAAKFGEDPADTKRKIIESIIALIKDTEKTKKEQAYRGKLEIRIHSTLPTYTFYRVEEKSYFTWYPFKSGKGANLPVIELTDGRVQRFLAEDWEKLWEADDTTQMYFSKDDASENRERLKSIGYDETKLAPEDSDDIFLQAN